MILPVIEWASARGKTSWWSYFHLPFCLVLPHWSDVKESTQESYLCCCCRWGVWCLHAGSHPEWWTSNNTSGISRYCTGVLTKYYLFYLFYLFIFYLYLYIFFSFIYLFVLYWKIFHPYDYDQHYAARKWWRDRGKPSYM